MGFFPARLGAAYSPLNYLAALGAGGLAVSFFMYLLFWVPHPGQPVPVFEDISAAFAANDWPMQTAIAVAGVLFFSMLHLRLLVWNIAGYRVFRKSDSFGPFRNSNAETQLLALPLTYAMSINVGFVLGLVLVPGLWGFVEYLFPPAIVAFALVGWQALSLIGDFLGRVLSKGGNFDLTRNNSFAQMLPAFALAMIGVGFSAPAGMSTTPVTVGIALVLSTFFLVAATLYAAVALVTGVQSMMAHGTAEESAPTLLLMIPIITVLSILVLRQDHGMHTHFAVHEAAVETTVFLARALSLQVLFLLLGLVVMRRQGYVGRHVTGSVPSAGSFTLVCPGVALSVMLHFFVNSGLVPAGLVAKFDTGYWALTGLALAIQAATILLAFRLNAVNLSPRDSPAAALPA